MESELANATDFLSPSLDLRLGPAASYIQTRRMGTFFAPTQTHTPGGAVMRFSIASGTEWLDPQSVVVSFTVTNNNGGLATFATSTPHCFFRRLTVRMSNQQVEDIDFYGRTVEQFMRWIPMEKRRNFSTMGLGINDLRQAGDAAGNQANIKALPKADYLSGADLLAAGSRRVHMRLDLSGVFGTDKWIPCWALGGSGLEVSLQLVGTGTDAANVNEWALSDARLQADMCLLDSALQQTYAASVLSGTQLQLHLRTWDVTDHSIGPTNSGNFDIHLNRAMSRLATVFCSFTYAAYPGAHTGLVARTVQNYFQAPSDATEETCQSYITIGSTRFPDFSATGSREHYWRTLRALGTLGSLPHSSNCAASDYEQYSHIVGYDLEKMPSVYASGQNLAAGQDLLLHFRGYGGETGPNTLNTAYVALHHEIIVSIGAQGLTVLS